MSLKRALRRLGKVVKKVAPLAAVAGLGFALGPAGAGIGQRILGGLGRVVKTGAKLAAPVLDAAVRGQTQQSAASPGFDQASSATPDDYVRGPGRHRARFSGALPEPVEVEPVSRFAGGSDMSLQGSLTKLVTQRLTQRLSKSGQGFLSVGATSGYGRQASKPPAVVSLPGVGAFRTGGTMESFRPRSKRINPTNVKALRRALRRVEGFVKLEKRVDKILRHAAPAARSSRKSGFVKKR